MRIPTSTYRLQLNAGSGFREIRERLDYLQDLGISDIYASPIFLARPGSAHGYDIIDMNRFNAELGGDSGFSVLAGAVRERGMGWLQDIVPNHMAFDIENRMLTDLLRSGSASTYFDVFDIDWHHPAPNLHWKVMAPFLGGHYAEILETGEISLELESTGFEVRYYDQRFPLDTETESGLIRELFETFTATAPDRMADAGREIRAVIQLLENHPDEREKALLQLTYAVNREGAARQALKRLLESYAGKSGSPETTARLDRLLSRQRYRLTYWAAAADQINYRRFFDINHLITLRMHDPAVFEKTHRLILSLCGNGDFTGLRIDHVDGLRDPKAYLERLREHAPDTFLLVEKILAPGEPLPASWPVQGTTGYDFATLAGGLFRRPESGPAFSGLYARFIGRRHSFDLSVQEGKRRAMARQFAGDLDNIVHHLSRIAAKHRPGRDIPPSRLRSALAELLACFPVYRTYVDASGRSELDERMFTAAMNKARRHRESLAYEFDFLERIWNLDVDPDLFDGPEDAIGDEKRLWLDVILDCQQYTAPLTAKGLEDTALYNYNRFIALNEVGGAPDDFGAPAERFHAFCRERLARWPDTLNATATHDSKRGEDVRARLWVLTEIPDEWDREVTAWQEENAGLKPVVNGRRVPESNLEYLLYQTLLGAYPFAPEERDGFLHRIQAYAVKAAREAKSETDWQDPDTAYESGCREFLAQLLEVPPGGGADSRHEGDVGSVFLTRFLSFFERVAPFGIFNSLAQALVKITAPGIPDIYQGTEWFDFSLVDPDNRREVDYGRRQEALQAIRERERRDRPALLEELLRTRTDGRIKMYLIAAALAARREKPDLFRQGDYIPLETRGHREYHLVAFARRRSPDWAITAVPRFLIGLIEPGDLPLGREVWSDTAVTLPEGAPKDWQNVLTGETIRFENGRMDAGALFGRFPAALMIGGLDR